MSHETILTNARVVLPDAVVDGTVVIREGRIAEVQTGRSAAPGAEDLGGELLLPGLVEIHTDNLERHLQPRPSVYWPSPRAAVLAHDAQVAAAGITTVLDAIAVGDYREGGQRRRMLLDAVDAITRTREHGLFRADHLVHLRCEISDEGAVPLFEEMAANPLVRLVSLMDHTPGQRQWSDMKTYRNFHRTKNWTEEEFQTHIAEKKAAHDRVAEPNRRRILEGARTHGMALASHDDTTPAHVDEAHADGLTISEFPTTEAAARRARAVGMAIVMGAPNVVRGGSHSGNVSAGELAEAGLLDGLSSDYVPASLLHAAFILAHKGLGLPAAVATVSRRPAEMVGLPDRGAVIPGRRADLIRVRVVDDLPVVRAVWREGHAVA